jgi:hypothetical protein
MLSPYYLMASEHENSAVQKLEEQLLVSSLPPYSQTSGGSIPFSFLAENLERAYLSSRMQEKQNIAYNLVQEVMHYATDKPELEMFALLRLCLPSYDNRSVYGFKTYRLIKSFAKAFEKCGGVSGRTASSYLSEWIRRPEPVKQKSALISMPELAVAHAHALCFPPTQQKHTLSIRDVAAFCQHLTNMYKEKHKEVVIAATMSEHGTNKEIAGIKVDKIAEFLTTLIPFLSYLECKILVRVLLRSVSMGIGMKTFTGAILGGAARNRLDYQMDMARLAISVVNALREKEQTTIQHSTILCGVPFRSMTCHVVSSPYVMKWLFSKEDSIKTYVPPKDGRLVMHSNGRWYIPIKRSALHRNRFIDLESREVMASSYTRKHMELLREIKRNKQQFFNEALAFGMLISYIITKGEEGDSYLLLIRAMKPIEEHQIEFMDVDVVNDTPNQKKQTKKEIGELLINRFVIPNNAHATHQYTITVCPLDALDNLQLYDKRKAKKASDNAATPKGMIVQRKYDGDRMQAHLGITQDEKPKVQLFSKSGKPVHHLYTDVANEIAKKLSEQMQFLRGELPCILDGEIIVVDADQRPLPWSSAKWRYDSGKGGTSLESVSRKHTHSLNPTLVSVVNEGAYCENLEDGELAELTLAPLTALKDWDQLGSSEKKKMHVKVLDSDARLRFVVFDMLMLGGRVITDEPYSKRLAQIKTLKLLSSLKFTQPISQSYYIQNAEELVAQLAITVREKAEGLILKDPKGKYVFGRTPSQRKLKICGPDINCEVVGLGFTLSKNPRMWGILTAIMSEDKREFLVYNRVESIEGDAPYTAVEHILSLPSSVRVDDLRAAPCNTIDAGKYTILLVTNESGEEDVIRVTWQPKVKEATLYECTLCFLHGFPQDIHWLCNPLECLFGVSQRGDLHPLSCGEEVNVPRFPVCRIQWNDHQRSECDTPSSIIEKFNQACAEPTCIQEFLKRRVAQLRNKPPRAEKLEELRRILMGRRNQSEPWPQKLDTLYKLEDFSTLLEENGFEPLTQGERHVLCGLQPRSQWDQFLVKKVKIIDSEEVLAMKEERENILPFLTAKLRHYKKLLDARQLRHPIVNTASHLDTSAPKNALTGNAGDENEKMEEYAITIPLIPSPDTSEAEDEDEGLSEDSSLPQDEPLESHPDAMDSMYHYHDSSNRCDGVEYTPQENTRLMHEVWGGEGYSAYDEHPERLKCGEDMIIQGYSAYEEHHERLEYGEDMFVQGDLPGTYPLPQ